METIFASVDAGTRIANAVIRKGSDGKPSLVAIPAVRAISTGQDYDLGSFQMSYDTVQWSGETILFGDDVVRVSDTGAERHEGPNRYGEEFHRFMVALALAKGGVKEGEVDLTLFVPPGLKELKQRIVEKFMEREVRIRLKGDKKDRVWHYSNVKVLYEGFAAAMAFRYDQHGKPHDDDFFNGSVVFGDGGFFSFDIAAFFDGQLNPELMAVDTIQNGGVRTHIIDPLLQAVHKKGQAYKLVSEDDLDFVMRQWKATGEAVLKHPAGDLDLAGGFERRCVRYADWIANTVLDQALDMRRFHKYVPVGGHYHLVMQPLTEIGAYNEKIVDPRKYPTTKKYDPAFLNAIGGDCFNRSLRK